MTFSELGIKHRYDSRESDVYNEFFNKILPRANLYQRFGGLFSSKNFALCAEGMQDFIQANSGIMELAIIPIFSEEDRNALVKGISLDEVIAKNWINELSQIKEKFLEDHAKALAWMISNQYLTIKLIIPVHDDVPLTEEELKEHEIFRIHRAILYDKDTRKSISFHGIIDRESEEFGEFYQIDVFRHWITSEEERIRSDHNEFSNMWYNEMAEFGKIKLKILPLSPQIKEFLQKIAPKSKEEIPVLKKLPILRDYQKYAVQRWKENGGRGIFEMATGTGKTYTAIGCIKEIEEKEEHLLVIIAVPYENLTHQWKKELANWFIDSSVLGDSGPWKQILRDTIHSVSKIKQMKVLITTYAKLSSSDFVKLIEGVNIPSFLIADESHHAGSFTTQNGLSKIYQYRLALSATISRYYDNDGTDYLFNYFKGTVYDYPLKKAIDDKKLVEYNYYPHFVDLSTEEYEKYKNQTKLIARLLNSKNDESRKKAENMIINRAKIIRDAQQKIEAFKEILSLIPKIKYTLIFCSEKQMPTINQILINAPQEIPKRNKPILYHEITHKIPKNPKDRIKILADFAGEKWDAIVANKVLDEGADIPEAKICIVLASTGNPAQFIQRRGRVLRKFSEPYTDGTSKTHADIYDILVRPQFDPSLSKDEIKLEISIIKNQLDRLKEMGNMAKNKEYCLAEIEKFTANIPHDVFENS